MSSTFLPHWLSISFPISSENISFSLLTLSATCPRLRLLFNWNVCDRSRGTHRCGAGLSATSGPSQGLETVCLELSSLPFNKTHTPVILGFDKQMTWQGPGPLRSRAGPGESWPLSSSGHPLDIQSSAVGHSQHCGHINAQDLVLFSSGVFSLEI